MRTWLHRPVVVALVALLIGACAGPEPAPRPDIQATVEAAVEATVVAQATPPPTPAPTLSPTPSPTPTPTPTSRPPAADGSLPLLASFVGIERLPLPCCRLGPFSAIAAGPTSLVLVTQETLTIRDKSGSVIDTKRISEFLNTVISPGGHAGGDPTVVFDPDSGRFFYVAEGRGGESDCEPGACISHIVLAVSRTSSPATLGPDDWHFYALDRTLERTLEGTNRTTNWGDFDRIGVTKDVVVISWLSYSFIVPASPSDFQKGARVRIIDKSQLLDGDPVITWTDFVLKDPQSGGAIFSPVIPAFHFGTSAPFFLVSLAWPCGFVVWGIENPLSSPTLSSRYLAGSCSDSFNPQPSDAVQPNRKWPIDNGWGMKAYPVYRDGSLWVAHAIRHDFGSGGVSAIRWAEIDIRNWPNSISFVQDAVLGADGVWNFIPSVMVDASNNMVLSFAQSSAIEFPSLYYTGRLSTDPPNTLRPTALLKAGTSTVELIDNSRNRYGGYFSAALDPADGSIWIFGDYAKAKDEVGKWVGKTDFEHLGAPTPAPTPMGDITAVTGDEGLSSARLNPRGIALDDVGNLYVVDTDNQRVLKVDTGGTITTVAGNGDAGFSGDGGPATSARLSRPTGVALDGAGNLYITDSANQRIRKVDTSGTITTVAGTGEVGFSGDGGPATSARLSGPRGIALDGAGNLYIADNANHRIRKVDTSGTITTVAGTRERGFSGDGGPATSARLSGPRAIALDSAGNLYIADRDNQRIRKVDTGGTITTVAGTGDRPCVPWPPAVNDMLQRLPVVEGLCLVRAPGTGPSQYIARDRTVVYVSPAPASGEIGSIAHEICHAHQHRVALDAGTYPGPLLGWLASPEGTDFVEITGWRLDDDRWIEQSEPWSFGYPNPLEESAQFCAAYYNASGFFDAADLRRSAPLRYEWATRWLPVRADDDHGSELE